MLITGLARANNVRISEFEIKNKELFAEFSQTYMTEPQNWINRLDAIVNGGELEEINFISFQAKQAEITTNRLMRPVFYLEKSKENLYELKSDLEEGRVIVYMFKCDQNGAGILTLKSVRYKSIRSIFDKVPEWNVGKPEIIEIQEFEFNEAVLFESKWRLFDVKTMDDLLVIMAIRMETGEGGIH